jgi:hypothetical protein
MKYNKIIAALAFGTMCLITTQVSAQTQSEQDRIDSSQTNYQNEQARSQKIKDETALENAKNDRRETKAKAREANRIGREADDAARESRSALRAEKKAQKARKQADRQTRKASQAREKSNSNQR